MFITQSPSATLTSQAERLVKRFGLYGARRYAEKMFDQHSTQKWALIYLYLESRPTLH